MRHVLIIDVGTGGIHTSLADARGRLSANSYGEIRYRYDAAVKGYDFDALQFYDRLTALVRETLAKGGCEADDIKAIGVTSQRHGCVFLDSGDRPLAAFPNLDGRSEQLAAEIGRAHGGKIFDRTARWPACWFPAARIAWYRRERPEIGANIASLMMLNEYVVFRLTGERVSEWTNAAETMFFDIHSQTWRSDLIDMFEAGGIALNRIVPTGSVAGLLTAAESERLGLPRLPVVIAASDTQSAVMGCGPVADGEVVVVNGSTTPLFMPLAAKLLDAKRRVCTDPFFGDRWGLEGNCTQSGLAHRRLLDQLLNLARRLPGQENLRREDLYPLFAGDSDDPTGITMHWGPVVSDLGKGADLGRRFIVAESNECDVFSGLIPAFVENLAFAIQDNAEQMAEIAGLSLGRIYLTGGGSANRRLQRALAHLNPDREVMLLRELETTSRGVAIQCWLAVGAYADAGQAYDAMMDSPWFSPLQPCDYPGLRDRHRQWRNGLRLTCA